MEQLLRRHAQGHARPARPLPQDGPRPRDRLRDGRRKARRDLAQARELRQGHPLPAAVHGPDRGQGHLAQVVRGRRGEVAVHLQHQLRGRQEHRHVLGWPSADARPARRPGPADQGHRRIRVEGLPARQGPSAGRQPRVGLHQQLERQARAGLRLGRRRVHLRLGPAWADAQPRHPEVRQARPRLGHLGDERRGDAGPARARGRPDAAAAPGRAPPRPARRPSSCWTCSRRGVSRAARGSTASSTARSTTRVQRSPASSSASTSTRR